MNEEEKKAVKYFYNLRATIDESNMLFDEEINVKHGKETIKQITIILNLIEKLQKENKELKDKYATFVKMSCEIVEQSIPVQKVKDKIRHYQELQDNYIKKYDEINEGLQAMINVLQELIEEREEK